MSAAEGDPASRKRRSDFEHNRDLILDAANGSLTELGLGVSIAEIAKRAGVGSATVYRHFPSKEALIAAVFELRIAEYAHAIEAAQEAPSPEAAFRNTIHKIVELQARDRSFREILTSTNVNPETDPNFVMFGTVLLGSFAAARDAGVLRDDVADADVMLLLISSEGVARPTDRQSPRALERFVDLMLDGICHSKTALEGAPLEFDQVLGVARS